MAKFDHHCHTSRDLDTQLSTHVFIFNLAPRKDGTWGAIVSRELYKAQKQAGGVYRAALATELERQGYAVDRSSGNFRGSAIPHRVERALSKRRQAIEAAAEAHGYRSPKGMEMAALRTRHVKRSVGREALFETWRAEARALGFELASAHRMPNGERAVTTNRMPEAAIGAATSKLITTARVIDQSAGMPGIRVDLKQREREAERS